MEVQITNENFEKEVLNCKDTVIVDFYGTWCMPCKILAPIVEKVAKDNNIKLAKVDVDENESLVRSYKIMSVPTLLIFKNGELKATSAGVISENRILELIKWF